MMLCFFKAMLTDPGVVPPLWGFYMGDSETKRRRYCLMCHVFKPERCHHCSACNRCVLNMDHHCRNKYSAWINNCVGFYNRKYFLLLLFYVNINTYTVAISLFPQIYNELYLLYQTKHLPNSSQSLFIGTYTLNCMLSMTLTIFFKFHLKLALSNSTTIETMDKKVVNKVNYNKGINKNWEQIFGKNPWLWFLPLTGDSGKPIGDGVVWTVPVNIEIDDIPEDEMEKRNSSVMNDVNRKKDEESKSKEISTAPDSLGSRTEYTKNFYHPEVKQNSGRIGEKFTDDVLLSPEP